MENNQYILVKDITELELNSEYYVQGSSEPLKKIFDVNTDILSFIKLIKKGKISILNLSYFPRDSNNSMYYCVHHLLNLCYKEKWNDVLYALENYHFSRYAISSKIKEFRYWYTLTITEVPEKIVSEIESYHDSALETL
jgi:hypothetical protein